MNSAPMNERGAAQKNTDFRALLPELRDCRLVKSVRVKLRGVETLFLRTDFYRRINSAGELRIHPPRTRSGLQNTHETKGNVRGTG